MIKGLMVTTTGDIKPVELDGTLDGYYKALECDIIDCTVHRIGCKEYDIICDDEGLCKDSPKVTAVTKMYQPVLVGNLFICNNNGKGEFTSLTADEVTEILNNTTKIFDNELGFREVIQVWV